MKIAIAHLAAQPISCVTIIVMPGPGSRYDVQHVLISSGRGAGDLVEEHRLGVHARARAMATRCWPREAPDAAACRPADASRRGALAGPCLATPRTLTAPAVRLPDRAAGRG
jgi:hypothetical protein